MWRFMFFITSMVREETGVPHIKSHQWKWGWDDLHSDIAVTLSQELLTAGYIDKLIAGNEIPASCENHGVYAVIQGKRNKLEEASIKQLSVIKKLLDKYKRPVSNIITIKDNRVSIGGYKMPITSTNQNASDMINDPRSMTYPGYAKVMLSFFAELIGETFEFPSNRDQLQEGTVDADLFCDSINTEKNLLILRTLGDISWHGLHIPVWLDKGKFYGIYIDLRMPNPKFRKDHIPVLLYGHIPEL